MFKPIHKYLMFMHSLTDVLKMKLIQAMPGLEMQLTERELSLFVVFWKNT